MNRTEFLAQLERLLFDISQQERDEALDYYENYFDDAGPENEASVIRELGSPGKVAATIKADLQGGQGRYGEYTERGYEDERFRENDQVPQPIKLEKEQQDSRTSRSTEEQERAKRANYYRDRSYQTQGNAQQRHKAYERKNQRSAGTWALIIIAIVFASPIWLGLGGGLIGLIFGLLGGLIGILFGAGFGGAGLAIGGFVTAIMGIVKMFSNPALGLFTFGSGLLLFVLGMLFIIAFVWLAFRLTPAIIRGTINLIQKLFHRGKRGEHS